MKIVENIAKAKDVFENPVIAIGNFDGTHIGHQSLIRYLKNAASKIKGKSIIMTFNPHPLKVLSPKKCPPMIQTLKQKEEMLASLGVDGVIVIHFTKELSQMGARRFVEEILVKSIGIKGIVVGKAFEFGYRRSGNVPLLEEMSRKHGFEVFPVDEVKTSGGKVSSKTIRNLLKQGLMEEASTALGRPYMVDGAVVEGIHLGRQIGFPTANLMTENELFIPPGVYVVLAIVRGKKMRGIANVGIRPTVDTGVPLENRKQMMEVYLFDFKGSLYGEKIRVEVLHMIRDEKMFDSLEDLVHAIKRDIEASKVYFEEK